MINKSKKETIFDIIISLVFIALGIVLLNYPETSINITAYVISGVMLLVSVLSFIKTFNKESKTMININLAYAVVALVLAIVLIAKPFTLATIIRIITALWIIMSSITKTKYALELREVKNWYIILILALINITAGIILILMPLKMDETFLTALVMLIYSTINIKNNIIIDIFSKKVTKEELKIEEKE